MSAASTSRIWESPSEPSHSNHSSRSAQLPSITTLTQALPLGGTGAGSSPTYPTSHRDRDSEQWPSQPHSTRELFLPFPSSSSHPWPDDANAVVPGLGLAELMCVRFVRLFIRPQWLLPFLLNSLAPPRLQLESIRSDLTSGRVLEHPKLRRPPSVPWLRSTAEFGTSYPQSIS